MYRKAGLAMLLLLFVLAGCRINTAPMIASFTASPNSGQAPLTVTFTVSATDADNDPLTCKVNFGDGAISPNFACAASSSIKHSYSAEGSYTAFVTVSDGRGGKDSASALITVTAAAPGPKDSCPAPSGKSSSAQTFTDEIPKGIGQFENVAYVPGELLVFKGNVSLQSAKVARLEAELGLQRVDDPDLASGWVLYRAQSGNEEAIARSIVEKGLGTYVQPNYIYKALAAPNDPHYSNHQKTQYDLMQITQAWDKLPSSPCRPVVGVIDSGTANDHPDLDDNVIAGYDASDGDDNPYPEAGEDHGTIVSSIIGAETNNNKGMAGASNNLAIIMPLKVFPNSTSDVIAKAIDWGREHGAHVFNLSLCITDSNGKCSDLTDNPDKVFDAALKRAYDQGIVSFAAAGNDNNDFVGYPGSSDYTIAVGATDNSNPPKRASFSNYGDDLDVVAPGVKVLGALIPTDSESEPYGKGNGTSFASPYAAGVAALYISRYYASKNALPSPQLVRTCMRSTAGDLGPSGWDSEFGAGIVRADRMLDTGNSTCFP